MQEKEVAKYNSTIKPNTTAIIAVPRIYGFDFRHPDMILGPAVSSIPLLDSRTLTDSEHLSKTPSGLSCFTNQKDSGTPLMVCTRSQNISEQNCHAYQEIIRTGASIPQFVTSTREVSCALFNTPLSDFEKYQKYPPGSAKSLAVIQHWQNSYAPLQNCTGEGVYIIYSGHDSRLYIGISNDLDTRFGTHLTNWIGKLVICPELQASINRLGIDNFRVVIIRGVVEYTPEMLPQRGSLL